MRICNTTTKLLLASTLLSCISVANAQDKPNIVLVYMDNFGWGEPGFNGGGIIRGAPTPRLDHLAAEGLRLTNFNVESQCTPSRAAIMSGRYAIRTGNGHDPARRRRLRPRAMGGHDGRDSLGRRLRHRHVRQVAPGSYRGPLPDRPGLRRVVRHSEFERTRRPGNCWTATRESGVEGTYIYEGEKGSAPRRVMDYNLEQRALIDKDLTDKAIDFMTRQAKAEKPFFLFVPYTQTHYPALPHPDFAGKTGNGRFADVWPRSMPITVCCSMPSMTWQSGTTRCLSLPQTTGRGRSPRGRTPQPSITDPGNGRPVAWHAVHGFRR